MKRISKTTKRVIKALSLLGITSCLIVSGIWIALAVQGVTIFVGQSSGLNYSSSENGTLVQTQPGNLTFLEIAGTAGGSSNIHWAGFYGNISGNLSLQNANGDVFYSWVGIGTPEGEVFASNTSSVSWSTVNCTNSTHIDSINAYLNISGSSRDSVNETYYANSHPAFSVATQAIPANACNSTNAYSNSVLDAGLFYQILLADSNSIPVYVALMNASSAAYDGSPVDFELLAGVPNGPAAFSLYFFMELG